MSIMIAGRHALGALVVILAVSAALGRYCLAADIWPCTPLDKVLPGAQPAAERALSIEAARNEIASAQVAVRSDADLGVATAVLSDLRGPALLPASVAHLQWVRCIVVKRNTNGVPQDELVAKAPCELPDPFWESPTIDLKAGRTQALWIELKLPPDAKPGDYTGELSVQWKDGKATLPVKLHVWDFEVPDERHQVVTNWFTFPGAGYDLKQDDPAYWELLQKFAECLAEHRQNVFRASLGWVKTTYTKEGEFKCDFTFLDRWADAFFGTGKFQRMELFQAGRREHGHVDPRSQILIAAPNVKIEDPAITLRDDQKLAGVLKQLEKHIHEKGWQGKVMMHVSDEPFIYQVTTYRGVAEAIHRAAPSIKVIEAIETTNFGKAIDVQVPKLSHLNLWYDHYRQVQEQGVELWFYTCCHPVGRYPNRFLDQPLVKMRALHWICYLYDLDGYLHWGLNYFAGGHDPYSEEGISQNLPLGDRAILYPGKEGPIGSLRFSAMRDGLQDYEYLWVLEDLVREMKLRHGAAADWIQPRQRGQELCRRVVQSFYEHTRDPEVMLSTRRAIAGEIERLRLGPILYVQTEPMDGTTVPAGPRVIQIRGLTEPGAEVTINGQSKLRMMPDGVFIATHFLSADGKVTVMSKTKDGAVVEAVRRFPSE